MKTPKHSHEKKPVAYLMRLFCNYTCNEVLKVWILRQPALSLTLVRKAVAYVGKIFTPVDVEKSMIGCVF